MRKVWFIFGATFFFLTVAIFFPFYLLFFLVLGKRAVRPLIWCSHKVVSRIVLGLMLIRLRVHGRELVDNQQNYVLVANHQAMLDILCCAIAAPFLFKFLAKKELTKLPLFGYIVRWFCVVVDRKNAASRKESFENMKAALAQDFSVFIAPEGTRNQTDAPLQKFYDGAFRLAIETQKPLLVLTLVNPKDLNDPRKKMDLSSGVVDCYFDVAIETVGMGLEDVPKVEEQVRQLMLKHLTLTDRNVRVR